MYRVVQGSTRGLPDVEAFLVTLDTLDRHPERDVRELFDPRGDLIVTRAPGRLDVMGGVADYSGSLVLELPLAEATLVALQPTPARTLTIVSLPTSGGRGSPRTFTIPLAEFERGGGLDDYAEARAYFDRDRDRRWAAYVAGAFLVLARDCGATFTGGARILIASNVPEGRGVGSSAALEVAVMQAVTDTYGITCRPIEIARLCQMVENHVVGAPCGVMDQMTSVLGEANRLLALLCQPADVQGTIPVPPAIGFWGIDSGVSHSVAGAEYVSARIGAFMGYRVIADLEGLPFSGPAADGIVSVDDRRWNGYLANIEPSSFERLYAPRLPREIEGDEFLARYGGTTDPVTRIDPGRSYPVRMPTAHPIHEHARVRAFRDRLQAPVADADVSALGALMLESHASYSSCGLGAPETDLLVDLVRRQGPGSGLFAAKITGGGCGGTVAVLGHGASGAAVEEIAQRYARSRAAGAGPASRTPGPERAAIFSGSSPGAAAFGHLRLTPAG
jgi:L-arabinokinase